MKTVFIIEDQPLIREGLIQIIGRETDMSVCGESGDGEEAFKAVCSLNPDLVITGLFLKSGGGLSIVRKIKAKFPGTYILVLSSRGGGFFAERALKAGANGYLLKEETAEKIGAAVTKIFNGETYLTERLKSAMLEKYIFRDTSGGSSIERLSDREAEVFAMIGKGFGTAEIAEMFGLSVKTVESHRLHIKRKLNIKKAPELVHLAFLWGQKEQK